MAVTLTNLLDKVRKTTDTENSTGRHPDTDLTDYINDGMKALYMLAQRAGILRYEKMEDITLTGAVSYSLPADYFGTIAMWLEHSDNNYQLSHYDIQARPFAGVMSETSDFPSGYRVTNDEGTWKAEFWPRPGAGTVKHAYVPTLTELSSGSDEVTVFLAVMGWERYIVKHAAVEVFTKDDIPTDTLEKQLYRMEMRIKDDGEMREMTATYGVNDVRGNNIDRGGDFLGTYSYFPYSFGLYS
jgi:hypothetical protein